MIAPSFRRRLGVCAWSVVVAVAPLALPARLVETTEPAAAAAADAESGLHGAATLRGWVQPEFPAEARKARQAGHVVVDFIVDAAGRVMEVAAVESSSLVFEAAALEAVRQWTFSPALDDGRPVACGMRVRVEFPLAQLKQKRKPDFPDRAHLLPVPAPLTRGRVITAPDPDYPDELLELQLAGEVRLEFTVGADGRAVDPRVQWASHPAFVAEALRAATRSRFEPARQGLLPRPVPMQYPVKFWSVGAKRADMLAACGLKLLAPPPRILPQPFVYAEPVYPWERLLAGESGEATVAFTLDAEGLADGAQVVSATAPEFGAALLAAVESWVFQPASADHAPVRVPMEVTHRFAPPRDGPVARLLPRLRPGGAGIPPPEQLDAPLRPLWRGFPAYPAQLHGERVEGGATIEFVIDADGRVRLPRVVAATRPEFGWAAATAVAQWVFAPLRRSGAPTAVRVQVEIGFRPPD